MRLGGYEVYKVEQHARIMLDRYSHFYSVDLNCNTCSCVWLLHAKLHRVFSDRLGLCTEAWTALLRRRDFEEMTIEFSAAVSSRLKTLT